MWIMTPFDLPGRAFLLFYAGLIAVLALLARVLRAYLERGPIPRLEQVDPYLIAYLRGGADEAIRVVAFALLDRGLLEWDGDRLRTREGALEQARRPLERSVLEVLRVPRALAGVSAEAPVQQAFAALARELTALGLLPGLRQKTTRFIIVGTVLAIGWAVASVKIAIALERGRSNIGFLVLFAIALPLILYFALRARNTSTGDRLIEDLQQLFKRLRWRSRDLHMGGATNELALLAGVYGMTALQGDARIAAQKMSRVKEAGASGSSCGTTTSCGSSASSSCGSSCGGGGGGGGCGGCGS
jgi:uncharacterized protein (TIGR04222 family)